LRMDEFSIQRPRNCARAPHSAERFIINGIGENLSLDHNE
jgi:hypothetical protein